MQKQGGPLLFYGSGIAPIFYKGIREPLFSIREWEEQEDG